MWTNTACLWTKTLLIIAICTILFQAKEAIKKLFDRDIFHRVHPEDVQRIVTKVLTMLPIITHINLHYLCVMHSFEMPTTIGLELPPLSLATVYSYLKCARERL
jgi:hypothetical protein